jgi:magnesium-transporting ATPase (P-type)
LVAFLFWGQQFLGLSYPEEEPFYYDDPVTGEVIFTQKTLHYTFMFNTFVFMQVFNEINARKLGENEYNVFKGFFNNFMFIFILVITIVVQIFLVQHGGIPMRACPLSWQ